MSIKYSDGCAVFSEGKVIIIPPVAIKDASESDHSIENCVGE